MPALAANDSANDNPSASLPISVDQLLVVLPLGIAVIYVVTAARLHTEFTCGALNQLRCTGVSGAYYWSVQLVADSVQYSLSSTLSALAVVFASWLFGADVQYDSDVIECQVLAIFIFMPVSLLLLYVTVLLLRNSSAALVGFCATLIFFVLPSASNGLLQSQLVSDDPKNSFPMYYRALLLFPNTLLYCAFAALKYPTIVDPSGTYEFADYFKPENQFVWFCVAGVSHTIILTIAVLLLHKHFLEKHASIFGQPRERQTSSNTEYLQVDTHTRDSDVVAEEQTINNLVTSGFSDGREAGDLPALVCHNLTLTYNSCKFKRCCCTKKTKTAVNSLTMSATNSQIFGLLGPNGAGKTSTLKVVAGSERATLGTVFVGGKPIASMPLAQLFDKVSVCTQDDSLWPMLTIRDHLNYYARLRGFQGSTRKQLVDLLIELLEIGGHAHKRCEQLSGGTKRKVVFAISMLRTSRMRLILCDEPTSGLDPQSKRVIWNLLMALFRGESQCACVFTSHSMEEVEAVCDRIGIMINGELHCLGTIQNCKDKYGGVYCIELKLKSAQGFDRLWTYLHSKFPSAFQCDSYVNTNVRINVPRADVTSLGYAFQVLEETRQDLSYEVEEYSFGQSTLEQVFLDLVKKHGADSID